MVVWPGITWREIDQEWTDSQLFLFAWRAEERLREEQDELERARRGERRDPWRAKWKPTGKSAVTGFGRYPRLKSDRVKRTGAQSDGH